MKRTQVMGGLLAAIALAICCLARPGVLLAGKGGGGKKSSQPPPTPVNFDIAHFGPLPGGSTTWPAAMNNHTEVVGASWIGQSPYSVNEFQHAFSYSYATNTMVDLNDQFQTDQLTAPDGSEFAFDGQTGWLVVDARDINDSGQIICILDYYKEGTLQNSVAARYTPSSTPARLDFLDWPAAGSPSAAAINNQGDVVGGGYLWTDAKPVDQYGWLTANPLPHSTSDLNDEDSAGWVQIIGDNHRYTVNVSTLEVTDDFDLGTLYTKAGPSVNDTVTNYVVSINNSGDVAAYSHLISWSHGEHQEASRYRDGDGLVGLGSYGNDMSASTGMNSSGDVAGVYLTSTNEWHLFLYSDAFGGMTDLSAKILSANGVDIGAGVVRINNNGEICGGGYLLIPQP